MKLRKTNDAKRPTSSNWPALVPGTVIASCITCPVLSQDAEQLIEEVVVTGSRIPRAGFETLQPATVIDAERLELRGTPDLGTMLNEQAGFTTTSVTPVGQQGFDTVGQFFPNFLGLSRQRTLTLVNGKRFPSGVSVADTGGLSVDLNTIPEALVERIETIAVGGAPVYGSDAIAGTVNVILKDDFEGLDVTAQAGTSPEFNDARRALLSATWGSEIDAGRGNFAIALQYRGTEGLVYTDRPPTENRLNFQPPADPDAPFDLALIENETIGVASVNGSPLYFGDQGFLSVFGNGIPFDINDPSSPLSQFDADGNLFPYVLGEATGSPIFYNGGDGLRVVDTTSLLVDSERYNLTTFLNYDLSNSLRLTAEAWYTHSDNIVLINQPRNNAPAFGGLPENGYGNVGDGPIPILIDNPFLTTASRESITAALNVTHDFDGDGLADPTIDTDGDGNPDAVGFWRDGGLGRVTGDNRSSNSRELLRGVIGLDGQLNVGERSFKWDAYLSYGRVESSREGLWLIEPNFNQALQVSTDADGNPVCVDPTGGCVPLNVLGTPTPEAVRYVSSSAEDISTTEQAVAAANVVGDILEVPGGAVSMAVGVHYREESASFEPNHLAQEGLLLFPIEAIDGEFDTLEFYAEAVVPLIGPDMDVPLIDRLEFEGAARFVDNSVAGTDTTWTAGLRYAPNPAIQLRGNLTQSIRAPSITQLFTPERVIGFNVNDPCDQRFINQGAVPELRAANCAADGIVQPFDSLRVSAGGAGTQSGNPDLDSEVADSWTVGAVLTPGPLSGLRVSIDWFDIEISNTINELRPDAILNACYDSANFRAEPLCEQFERDAEGQIVDISTGFFNAGLTDFAALQTVVSYFVPVGAFGDLFVDVNYLYTHEHTVTPGSGNTVRLDGRIGRSRHRVNTAITWTAGDWRWYNQVRWLSSAVFDNEAAPGTFEVAGVDSWAVYDTSLAYTFSESVQIQLNIDNVLNEEPPYPAMVEGIGPQTYFPGVLGRYAFFTVRARF